MNGTWLVVLGALLAASPLLALLAWMWHAEGTWFVLGLLAVFAALVSIIGGGVALIMLGLS